MRTAVLVLCTLGVMAAMPSALAQEARRDPFEPLVDEDAGVTVVPGAGTGTDTTADGTADGSTTTGDTTEGTPNTGMETADLTGLGYFLIVMGASAVTLARLRRPITTPRRR